MFSGIVKELWLLVSLKWGLIGQTPGLSCQRSTRAHDDIIFTANAIKNGIIVLDHEMIIACSLTFPTCQVTSSTSLVRDLTINLVRDRLQCWLHQNFTIIYSQHLINWQC